jgi:hypothetical protein
MLETPVAPNRVHGTPQIPALACKFPGKPSPARVSTYTDVPLPSARARSRVSVEPGRNDYGIITPIRRRRKEEEIELAQVVLRNKGGDPGYDTPDKRTSEGGCPSVQSEAADSQPSGQLSGIRRHSQCSSQPSQRLFCGSNAFRIWNPAWICHRHAANRIQIVSQSCAVIKPRVGSKSSC